MPLLAAWQMPYLQFHNSNVPCTLLPDISMLFHCCFIFYFYCCCCLSKFNVDATATSGNALDVNHVIKIVLLLLPLHVTGKSLPLPLHHDPCFLGLHIAILMLAATVVMTVALAMLLVGVAITVWLPLPSPSHHHLYLCQLIVVSMFLF